MHYAVFTRTDHTPDESLGHYLANVGATLDAAGGRLLAFGAPTVLEGATQHTKVALLEFPDEQAARTWYASDAYQQLVAWRTEVMGHPVDLDLIAGF